MSGGEKVLIRVIRARTFTHLVIAVFSIHIYIYAHMYAYLFSFLLFTDIIVNNGVKTGILVENHKNKSTGYRWKCKRLHVDPVKKKKKKKRAPHCFQLLDLALQALSQGWEEKRG